MKGKLIAADAEKTYALIVDTGDAAVSGLLAFAQQHDLAGSHFTGIGAVLLSCSACLGNQQAPRHVSPSLQDIGRA